MTTIAGWLSIGIGIIGLVVAYLAYILGLLSDWSLAELEIGTRDEMVSRGPKVLYITTPGLYARIVFKVFNVPFGKTKAEMTALKQFLFWSAVFLLADRSNELPKKGFSFVFDAGNFGSFLGKLALVGSFLSLPLGLASIIVGIVTLV